MPTRQRSAQSPLKELQRLTALLNEEVVPRLLNGEPLGSGRPNGRGEADQPNSTPATGARQTLEELYHDLSPETASALSELFSTIDGHTPRAEPTEPEHAPATSKATSTAGVMRAAGAQRAARLSKRGAQFISNFEGLRTKLYNDPAGHCTIGVGHLVHRGRCNGKEPAEFKRGISKDRAFQMLQQDARRMESAVTRLGVPLNQNQFDALVSFTYNLGPGWTTQKTGLGDALRARRFKAVPRELNKWVRAGGKVLPGLVRRRKAEGRLFSTPAGPAPPPRPPGPVAVRDVQPGQHNASVLVVQEALRRAVGLDYSSGPGTFGPRTRAAYAKWQRKCGLSEDSATGRPDIKSLKMLGDKYGFKVAGGAPRAPKPRPRPPAPAGASAARQATA